MNNGYNFCDADKIWNCFDHLCLINFCCSLTIKEAYISCPVEVHIFSRSSVSYYRCSLVFITKYYLELSSPISLYKYLCLVLLFCCFFFSHLKCKSSVFLSYSINLIFLKNTFSFAIHKKHMLLQLPCFASWREWNWF